VEGGLHLSKLDEGDPQTPDVNSVIVGLVPERLTGHHFRGHPVGRSDEGVPLLVVLLVLGGHTKVGKFHLASCRK